MFAHVVGGIIVPGSVDNGGAVPDSVVLIVPLLGASGIDTLTEDVPVPNGAVPGDVPVFKGAVPKDVLGGGNGWFGPW